MGVVHYCDNDASCKDSTSNAHLVGLMEGCSAGAEGDIEDNGAEEGGWHSLLFLVFLIIYDCTMLQVEFPI